MSQVTDQSSGSAPTSPQFAETLQRAFMYAEEQSHRLVTAEHLLLALTEDPDCMAVLRRKTIDVDHLRNEVAGLVSRNFDRFTHGDVGQPIYGADLLRVLNTAGAAASARRPIDGALALAATIADGRTPASELIKLYGLTFDDATKVPRPQPQPATPSLPPLASLRTAARESALGMRKRPPMPQTDDLSDEPLNLPLPLANSRQQSVQENGGRAQTSLRRAPPNGQFYAEPGPPMVNGQQYNGHAPAQRVNGIDHDHRAWNGSAAGSMNGALPEPAPAYAQPPYEAPEAPDHAYPYDAPEWQAVPPQDGYAYADTPAPQPLPQSRRQQPVDEPPAAAGSTGKTRGRKGGKSRRRTGQGVLAENIPRSMQAGVPVAVEARIARHEIETALVNLDRAGDQAGAYPAIVHTMAVRLRSLDGAVQIECNSPETQWIDGAPGLIDDEYANWRWTLTPPAAGPARLQLISSIRRVDEDGLSAEFALPEQTVDVRIAANTGRLARKALAWVGLIAVAMILGALAESLFHIGHRLLGR